MTEQQPKLSIITAVYNQLAMNQIYWENLVKYTQHSFELIVIDNASTDASADFLNRSVRVSFATRATIRTLFRRTKALPLPKANGWRS